MGHKVSVEVSPVIRQDDKTSIITLRLSRTKDDASINAVDAHFDNSDDNKLSISNYLGVPSVFRPGSGASWTKLLDLSATQSSLDQSSHAARYLVGGPGWSGAGPVAVGMGVLPLSLDDPGAKVTCGSRTLVTADKGNGPLRVRSFACVGAEPVVHRLAPHPCSERWQERWISRTSTSSVGTRRRQGASTGPRP